MSSVYIETTIPSFYFETRTNEQAKLFRDATRRWWDAQSARYELVTSDFTLEELSLAPPAKADKAQSLLRNVRVLETPGSLLSVVEFYLENKLMPEGAGGDAFHLAVASLHRVDFLLTWNCRHLANANKTSHIAAVNQRLGLPSPIIATPWNMMGEDE